MQVTIHKSGAFLFEDVIGIATKNENSAKFLTGGKEISFSTKVSLVGSTVTLRADVVARLAETRYSGAFNLPGNVNVSLDYLPERALRWVGAQASDEYVVIDAHFVAASSEFRHEAGQLVMLKLAKKMAPESVIDYTYQLQPLDILHVPAGMVDVHSFGNPFVPPVRGRSYVCSGSTLQEAAYFAIDQTFEGFKNRPTAELGLAIQTCAQNMAKVKAIRTSKGKITPAGLRKLVRQQKWTDQFVSQDSCYTTGFPKTAPFIEFIDYDELAEFFTSLCSSPV